jgi:pyridoxine/pyridoxamine 5'-phosphate oxidase
MTGLFSDLIDTQTRVNVRRSRAMAAQIAALGSSHSDHVAHIAEIEKQIDAFSARLDAALGIKGGSHV